MWTERMWAPLVAILLVAGCGGDAGQGGAGDRGGDTGAVSQEGADDAGQREEADRPETVADLFPEGEGKMLVLNNCASCHALACAAMGQRTASRWGSIEESHREHVPSLAEDDLETIFGYLQENFNPETPEPEIPAAFLQRGCTPF